MLCRLCPWENSLNRFSGADLGGGCRGCAPPPPWDEAFFLVLGFKICLPRRSVTSFLRGAPHPNKNPGSAPDFDRHNATCAIKINKKVNKTVLIFSLFVLGIKVPFAEKWASFIEQAR